MSDRHNQGAASLNSKDDLKWVAVHQIVAVFLAAVGKSFGIGSNRIQRPSKLLFKPSRRTLASFGVPS